MKIFKFTVCLLFGLMFVFAGMTKFVHMGNDPKMSHEMQKVMEAFMTIRWLMPLVGTIEIIGGVLFAVPRTRALGAIVILPVLMGIILHNIVFMPSALLIGGILLLIEIWIIVDNKHKYKVLLSKE